MGAIMLVDVRIGGKKVVRGILQSGRGIVSWEQVLATIQSCY